MSGSNASLWWTACSWKLCSLFNQQRQRTRGRGGGNRSVVKWRGASDDCASATAHQMFSGCPVWLCNLFFFVFFFPSSQTTGEEELQCPKSRFERCAPCFKLILRCGTHIVLQTKHSDIDTQARVFHLSVRQEKSVETWLRKNVDNAVISSACEGCWTICRCLLLVSYSGFVDVCVHVHPHLSGEL